MPLSLRIIKECTEYKLDWRGIHIIDLFSILFSIRIDNVERYLKNEKQRQLNARGYDQIQLASQNDFDSL